MSAGALLACAAYACGSAGRADPAQGADADAGEIVAPPGPPLGSLDGGPGDGGSPCPALPSSALSADIALAAPYDAVYSVYELGPVPGIPSTAPLGGTVLLADTTDTLLVGGGSEQADGAIFSIKVKRDACQHMVAFDGTAAKVANAPYVDANLVYGPDGTLLFPMWSSAGVHKIGQLTEGSTQLVETSTQPLGIGGGGPGSMGFVPPTIAGAAGELRVLTQNGGGTRDGFWYHVPWQVAGDKTLTLGQATQTRTLANWPGGFAYVPAGSPAFTEPSLIVTEWFASSVAVYRVDEKGDPVVATRAPFFSAFPRPWGAYFEPVTGDFLFLTWRASQGGQTIDKLYVVSGFKPPPPPPAPK